ncbi:SNF2 family N-terminal domain-containing protein, partial [Gymnopilus junonius]
MRGGICMGCMELALAPDPSRAGPKDLVQCKNGEDVHMKDGTTSAVDGPMRALARELLFRCFTCKRLAHYGHLPVPSVLSENAHVAEVAWHYQDSKSWLCADCSSYKYGVDKIIAWRPYPPDAVESRESNGLPNYKAPLPREYLVKWIGKLKHFISGGRKVELLEKPDIAEDDAMEIDQEPGSLFGNGLESRASSHKLNEIAVISPISPLPDAEKRIPKAWKRIDRVLDVLLLRTKEKKSNGTKKKSTRKRTISSSDDDSEAENMEKHVSALVFEKGEQPPDEITETVNEWENHQTLEKSDIDQVIWAFIKWDELGYEEATWDAPPRPNEPDYSFFQRAFNRFIDSREVLVPKKSTKYWDAFDDRKKDDYRKFLLKSASDLDLGQDPKYKLMPFQVDGFNWLCNNWWNHQHCILADEMGLGKTVQIVSFLGNIANNWNAFPALVVVPNSTITNWVREFERWAPRLRVVPFYGEKPARDVIQKFELFHDTASSEYTKAKFHILVTTYEALTNGKDFTPVFRNQPRWEVLVVDEGQRLKSDSSLLFKKLNELNSIHRIILTGTPLNNNMRELFNLMNFLDPAEWKDLEALEKQHEVLDEELVKQLHNRLRPYFLRRVKSEVLDLPPKNEVIVPISMAPLQREVYRSILSHNLNILNGLTQPWAGQNASKSRINNVLMQLRKCLQHPYLYAEDIEPRNLPQKEIHEKLIDASGKLRFLKALLPKLREHGHRILLTKSSVRQKAMDEFNKPNSEYFIFLLTTRAGGVGINLFTADTVIIFDPDFNPHQAIARAYRYGQKKTCLVFKLMVKDSAEERIMQVGKKKLVLDHLIVQKMDDDEDNGGENIQSILTYGAQALFESDQEARDIVYTDNDIEKLLEKTEKEAVKEVSKAAGLSFSFAKIWSADKDTMEDIVEDDQTDSWAMTLQKINAEREKEQERDIALSGRGARRKAADIAKTKLNVVADGAETFNTPKQKKKSVGSDGSAYFGSDGEFSESSASENDDILLDGDFKMNLDTSRHKSKSKNEIGDGLIDCGLCGQRHGPGQCQMIDRSENLAEYREMLILHADDEPWEERSAAVKAIDEILHKRGHLSLIAGQPLHPLPKGVSTVPLLQRHNPLPSRQYQNNASRSISSNGASSLNHAESSKHASSSQPSAHGQDPQKKKFKVASQASCVLCNQGSHLMKDCSIVRAGSKSISAHIKALEVRNDASMQSTIEILRNLLAKAKAREMLTASSS